MSGQAVGRSVPSSPPGAEPALVGYVRNGAPLGAEGGFARLIVPGDRTGGRAVPSIVAIDVR